MTSKYLILHRKGWPTRASLIRKLDRLYAALLFLENHKAILGDIRENVVQGGQAAIVAIESAHQSVVQARRALKQMELPL